MASSRVGVAVVEAGSTVIAISDLDLYKILGGSRGSTCWSHPVILEYFRKTLKNISIALQKSQISFDNVSKPYQKYVSDPRKSSKITEMLKNPRYFINEILKIHRERAKMRSKIEKP